MKKIDSLLTEWARDCVRTAHQSGFSGINIIEKILHDPGISTRGSRHRIHWWPSNKRIAEVSRAMHQVSQRGQLCLIVEYGKVVKPQDGQILTKEEFSKFMRFKVKVFDENITTARNILIPLLN